MKKYFSLLLLSLLPLLAQAATLINGIYYNLNSSSKTAEVTRGNYTGSVNIPPTIVNGGITYSVTSIGEGAFEGRSGLTSVTIPNSVTSIGRSAFWGCSGLTSVTIPNSVTSIGEAAFNYTPFINNMADGVIYLGKCLYEYKGTMPENTTIVIADGTTQICYCAFSDCSGLTSVTIPNSVTFIGYNAFDGCSGLTSVTIPNSVTSIGSLAFSGCSGLTSVHISDLAAWCNISFGYNDSNPLSYAHHLYLNGTEVTDLVIPNSVTSIGNSAFWGCRGLTSVTIPNSVTSIGNAAYWGCRGLTSVTIPNSVTSIGGSAFQSCSGLTSVTIPNSVTSIGDDAFQYCSGLTSVTIPNSVTSIGCQAFSSCSGLTSVTIPNSVTSIDEYAFSGCTGLTDVYCLPLDVPVTASNAFNNSNIGNATLHVVVSSYNAYKNALPWKNFKNMLGDIPVPCAAPVISYRNGQLVFDCDTEGVTFKSDITCEDIAAREESIIDLTVAYTITVYATKEGYTPSETVTATLCWIETEPVDAVATGTLEIAAVPVLVKSRGGVITVEGVGNGTTVSVYTTGGVLVGSATAVDRTATVSTSLPTGTVVVVKIGEKAVKIVVR